MDEFANVWTPFMQLFDVVWFACTTHLVLGSAGETERDRDAFRAEGKSGGVRKGETQK